MGLNIGLVETGLKHDNTFSQRKFQAPVQKNFCKLAVEVN